MAQTFFERSLTMKFLSQVLSAASGSVGGVTYSHNRGGMYQRTRATPTNPNTSRQQLVRSAFGTMATRWGTLTVAQRIAWEDYASHVAMTDKLGQTIYLTGQQHYIRSNVPRVQGGFAVVDNAPTVDDLGDFTAPGITSIDDTTAEITVTFTATDDWVGEDGSALLLYQSRSRNPSINFFKGPFVYCEGIEGDSVTPPTSPALVNTILPTTVGKRCWVRAQVSRADGRLSQSVIIGPTTIIGT